MRALRIVARRALAALPTVLIVTLGAFLLLESAPGDAADAYLAQTGGDAGFAAELRQRFGLGGSTPERLMRFYAGLLHGDLGPSAVFGRPVVAVILERLPTTLLLMGCAAAFTAGIGTLLGLIFVTMQSLAFATLAAQFRTAAASLLNLSRKRGIERPHRTKDVTRRYLRYPATLPQQPGRG